MRVGLVLARSAKIRRDWGVFIRKSKIDCVVYSNKFVRCGSGTSASTGTRARARARVQRRLHHLVVCVHAPPLWQDAGAHCHSVLAFAHSAPLCAREAPYLWARAQPTGALDAVRAPQCFRRPARLCATMRPFCAQYCARHKMGAAEPAPSRHEPVVVKAAWPAASLDAPPPRYGQTARPRN